MDKLYHALICLAEMYGYDLSLPQDNTLEFIEPIPDYDIPQNPNALSDTKFVKLGNGRIYDREKLKEEYAKLLKSHPRIKIIDHIGLLKHPKKGFTGLADIAGTP